MNNTLIMRTGVAALGVFFGYLALDSVRLENPTGVVIAASGAAVFVLYAVFPQRVVG